MSISEIKLYAINGSTLGVTTFTQIEDWLKIFLLVVTIGYTVTKWVKLKQDNEKNKYNEFVKNIKLMLYNNRDIVINTQKKRANKKKLASTTNTIGI